VARVDTTCWQLFRSDINTTHFFIFFVAEVMSSYLTTDGLKIFFSTSGAPRGPRPVAFAISATWLIRHWDRDKWRKYVNGGIRHSLTDNYWQLVGTTYPRCSRPVWVRQPSRGAMFHRAKSCDRQTKKRMDRSIAQCPTLMSGHITTHFILIFLSPPAQSRRQEN